MGDHLPAIIMHLVSSLISLARAQTLFLVKTFPINVEGIASPLFLHSG